MKRGKNASGWSRAAAVVHGWPQRVSWMALFTASLVLIVVAQSRPQWIEPIRTAVVDMATPLMVAVQQPVDAGRRIVAEVRHLVYLHQENARLRAENTQLRGWYHRALALDAENARLRDLLAYVPGEGERAIAARVIVDGGGPFVRSVAVAAGRRDGVARNQAALVGEALAGRVSEVGYWSARVLLVSDINSRVPVRVEETGQRAILAGDNGPAPRLIYLPGGEVPPEGSRIVTSGDGRLLPPGLPVGRVTTPVPGEARVRLYADLDRLHHLRLLESPVGDPDARQMPPLPSTPAPPAPAP